jgi:hypothetical protein
VNASLVCEHHRTAPPDRPDESNVENALLSRPKSCRIGAAPHWLNRERDEMQVSQVSQVSQKLQMARDLVAQGWIAGGYVSRGINGQFRYCAVGALNKAFLGRATPTAEMRPDDELRLAQRLLAEAMHGPFPVGSDSTAICRAIGTWNDSRGGADPKLQVVAAFDEAIAKCERLEADAQ